MAGPVKQEDGGSPAPAQRPGSLHSGLGRPEGLSKEKATVSTSGRKVRFLPTNFSRLKKEAGSSSDGGSRGSAGPSAKPDSVFEELIRAAAAEGRGRAGRGMLGRGPGPAPGRGAGSVTTFSGGGDGPTARAATSARHGVWGGTPSRDAGSGAGPSRAGGPGSAPGCAQPGGPGAKGGPALSVLEADLAVEEREEREDPWTLARYHPTTLPLPDGEGQAPATLRGSDPASAVPRDLMTREDPASATTSELDWLRDREANDGRLVLLQLPPVLPLLVPSGAPGPGGVAVDPRPAALADLPQTLVGKLQVMASGAVRLRVGEVALELSAGTPCLHAQEVCLLFPAARQAVSLGSLSQRIVAVPDLGALLSEEPLPEYRKSPACMAREGKEEGGPGEDRDGEGSRGGDSPSSPMEVDLVEGDGTVAEGGAADAQRLVAIKPDPGAVASPRRGARRLVMDEDD
uniref:DNA-directed RNA polymerase III subunit RPC4 n=1 Tax=Auxenochlorella protothecoides TaxID=3075 RepID=A0A1D1ZN42_AUXPR